jgi:hypothetical protein
MLAADIAGTERPGAAQDAAVDELPRAPSLRPQSM